MLHSKMSSRREAAAICMIARREQEADLKLLSSAFVREKRFKVTYEFV